MQTKNFILTKEIVIYNSTTTDNDGNRGVVVIPVAE